MKKTKTALPYLLAALGAGAGGFVLRLLERGGASALPLIGFSAAACLSFLIAALREKQETAFARVFRPVPADAVLSCLAGALLAAGSLVSLAASDTAASGYLLGALGVLAAVAVCASALNRLKGRPAKPLLYVLPVLFFVVKLLVVFPRKWMVDPTILDYCFCLFALLSFMLSSCGAAALSFDRGNRREVLLFSLTGVLFGLVSLPGASLPDALLYGGGAVWMLAYLFQAAAPTAPDASAAEDSSGSTARPA